MTAFDDWQRAPFPGGSSNDEVDDLHAQLAQWDAFIADLVIPLSRGSDVRRPRIDLRAGVNESLRGIRRQAAALAEEVDRLGEYKAYADLLLDVLQQFADQLGPEEGASAG